MRAYKAAAALLGLAVWGSAGVASAAGTPWSPKNDLYPLTYRFGSIALLLAAVGIAAGLFLTPLFRGRRPQIDAQTAQVQRHAPGYILMHWLNAIGFLLATFTGAIMLKWLAIPMDKVLLYTLHFIGAGCILIGMVGVVVHAWSRGTTTRHRLIPTGHQVREACIELLGYAGLVGDRGILGFPALQWPATLRRAIEKGVGFTGFERSGKYLAAEEVFSFPLWALVGVVIVTTGLLKAVRYVYPFSPEAIKWLTKLHDWAAIGTVVMLCLHVGALVLVRTNWPLFGSMFTSRVSLKYVQDVLGAWYDELTGKVSGGSAAARSEAAATVEPALAGKGNGGAGD